MGKKKYKQKQQEGPQQGQQQTHPASSGPGQSSLPQHEESPSTSQGTRVPQQLSGQHAPIQLSQQFPPQQVRSHQVLSQQRMTHPQQGPRPQSQSSLQRGDIGIQSLMQALPQYVQNPQFQPPPSAWQGPQQQLPIHHKQNRQYQSQPTARQNSQMHQQRQLSPQFAQRVQFRPRSTVQQSSPMPRQQLPTHQVQHYQVRPFQGHAQIPQMLPTSQPLAPLSQVTTSQVQETSTPQVEQSKDSYFQKQQGKKKGKPLATAKGAGVTSKSGSSSSLSVTPEVKADTKPQIHMQQDDSAKSTELDLIIPQRQKLQSGGTKGRKILIETNHLALMFKTLTTAVHYDVSLDPDKPKKLLRVAMEQFRKKYYPKRYPAFDNVKNLYSASLLPFGEEMTGEVTVPDEDREKIYKIKIKFANYVDLSTLAKYFEATGSKNNHKVTPQEAIQCIDIVLRNAPSLYCIPVGRSFFTKPTGRILDLGEGMESYYGFYQSAVLGWKPYLNVDVAHKPFPKSMAVLDLIVEIADHYDLRDLLQYENYEKVDKFIRTLKVHYEIPNQPATKRILRVNKLYKTAAEYRFTNDQNVMMTVEEYYRKIKRAPLRYPHLPCLWVGNMQRESPILFPPEFCTIVEGQVLNRQMTPFQTSNLIKIAATSTIDRKKKIMESVSRANYNDDMCAREFGISVKPEFTKVPARVLEPPDLKYFNNATVRPRKGVWRPEKFDEAMQLNDWCIVCVDARTSVPSLQDFAKMVVNEGSNLGMKIAVPKFIILKLQRSMEKRILEEQFKKLKTMTLILVVIPDRLKDIYSYVKQVAELTVGVVTQCVKAKNVFQKRSSTISNILLKINAKLNGRNHQLRVMPNCLKSSQCIIMGADVTHPSPENRGSTPSVAAVTASHDICAFQYNITWRLQPSTQEIITDLANVVHDHLLFYKKKNNVSPQRIIFFRDGVSEGQFEIVVNSEVQAIRRACAKLEPNKTYKPKLTFLVVQKRHHTRFFPMSERDSEDRNFNVPPGTVVDTEITHPTALDFYLVSHASIQGVARPTKYRKLWDDSDMNEDELEELTYHLCHLFTRCTRSVSYPAPTYYAHLAAARAKVYCERRQINMNNLEWEQSQLIIRDEVVKDFPMFFV
ncbi:hypothetical protein FQA39_LY15592 [Lamprigera yunnana]|nr:hypothetical protein FQA39_LY15592 [Lamprigera yunnana]